jgi:hypothetical protein
METSQKVALSYGKTVSFDVKELSFQLDSTFLSFVTIQDGVSNLVNFSRTFTTPLQRKKMIGRTRRSEDFELTKNKQNFGKT